MTYPIEDTMSQFDERWATDAVVPQREVAADLAQLVAVGYAREMGERAARLRAEEELAALRERIVELRANGRPRFARQAGRRFGD